MIESQFQEWYKDELMPSDDELNSLEHHGIKGMHWGVKHGPPYPLDEDVAKKVRKSKSQSSSNKKKPSGDEQASKKKKLRLTPTQKKLVIAGAAVAATGLAVYGAYKLGALDKLKNASKYGSVIDPITGLKRKTEIMSREKDLSLVNPGFPKKGTTLNCTHCVTAYELRRRGYDVQATTSATTKNFGIFGDYFKQYVTETLISKRNPGETEATFRKRAIEALEEELRSYGDGARGVIGVHNVDPVYGYSGHVFSWEVIKNAVHFMDAQQGASDARSILEGDSFIPDRYDYARLDDLPLKVGDFTKIVKNRK